MATDIKLIFNEDQQYYDIDFKNGDFLLTQGLETAILMSIYCQQRDDSIEVSSSRGGWAGNELQSVAGFQQGSKLWTLYQSAATEDVANLAQNFIEDALQWLIDDGIAEEISVVTSVIDNSKLQAEVTITRNSNIETFKFEDLFKNTINGS
jgi:hypothetical protein